MLNVAHIQKYHTANRQASFVLPLYSGVEGMKTYNSRVTVSGNKRLFKP